jgi:hypothetical protein
VSYVVAGLHSVPRFGRCDLGSGDVLLAGQILDRYKLFVDATEVARAS